MQWFYIKDSEQQGPVEEQELKSMLSDGTLSRDDKVWNETFEDQWVPAGEVTQLNIQSATPPELPKQPCKTPAPANKPGEISCTTVVTPAFERMKDILFRPFDMAKWFALGFSAWLATLGQGGGNSSGGGGNSSGGGGNSGTGEPSGDWDFELILDKCRDFIAENPWVIPLALMIVVILFALGIVMSWLRSRGKFMLLDNVVTNKALISEPWREFKAQGNSLFLWSLGYYFICTLIFAALAGLVYLCVKPCIDADDLLASSAIGILVVIFLFIICLVVCGYISRFLEDFVIAIMYRDRITTTEAWKKFSELMRPHRSAFIIYGLFYALLAMGAGMVLVILIVCTCCIALCPLAIPYIGSVMVLPITVFFRAYSLKYLSQFGDEYNLFDKFPAAGSTVTDEQAKT